MQGINPVAHCNETHATLEIALYMICRFTNKHFRSLETEDASCMTLHIAIEETITDESAVCRLNWMTTKTNTHTQFAGQFALRIRT
jgi:hypothetical protein